MTTAKLFGLPVLFGDGSKNIFGETPTEPTPSHVLERLHVTIPPFVYVGEDGDGHFCEGGELVLEGLDLHTSIESGTVYLKAQVRSSLRLLGEKEPKP